MAHATAMPAPSLYFPACAHAASRCPSPVVGPLPRPLRHRLNRGLSDRLVRVGISRARFLVTISAAMGLSHAAFIGGALTPPNSLLQASLLLSAALGGGLSFGAMWPHLVVLVSEILGSKHLSTNCALHPHPRGAACSASPCLMVSSPPRLPPPASASRLPPGRSWSLPHTS